MILPTKHVRPADSLLSVGAELLASLSSDRTVTELWDEMRDTPGIVSFERFVLALDLLFALGLIEFKRGILMRAQP
jgi:hypothetical protein